MEKMYPMEGNPNVLTSDIMECFEIFKKKTGGVIYQHKKVKVSEWNQDFIEKYWEWFKVIEHKETKEDKRVKSGVKEKVTYTYEYWGKEYTLKEINKKGVYLKVPIYFDNLVELLPYFGYIVSFMCAGGDKEEVVISNQNYIDELSDDFLESGCDSAFRIKSRYNKDLANLYRSVILEYFNPIGKERVETITFDENGVGKVSRPIDPNFKVDWILEKGTNHWTSPKVIDAQEGIIEMSSQDLEMYLGNVCDVYYVEKL